jgi:DNA-3-methyladenine glycosylase II
MTPEQHLSTYDPHLAPIIAAYGPHTIQPHTNYYQALVMSIIGQQLSVKAAASIKQRFLDLFGGSMPDPAELVAADPETLRSAGLSGQKTKYIQDLANHALSGRIVFDDIDQLRNDEIIARLTDVKGIGEWTAHMFLMFAVGRTDILATGDLGIRNGIRKLYGLEHAPTPEDIKAIADQYHWHPYESIACWYVWKSLDNEPVN